MAVVDTGIRPTLLQGIQKDFTTYDNQGNGDPTQLIKAESSGVLPVFPYNSGRTALDVNVTQIGGSSGGTGTLNVSNNGFITPSATQTIVNWTDTAQTGNGGGTSYAGQTVTNLRTNTATKTFYMTSLTVSGDATASGYFSIHDGATQIFASQFSASNSTAAGSSQNHFTFPTPIKFSTAVRFTQWFIAAKSCSVMFSGWEQ